MDSIKPQSTYFKMNRLPFNVPETINKDMVEANISRLQGERGIREGKNEQADIAFEQSKTLYAQLINKEELYEVQYEAYKQWVTLATTEFVYIAHRDYVDRVVREYKIDKLAKKLSSYIGLDSQVTATMKEQHIKINVELANFYRQEALTINTPRANLSPFEWVQDSGRDTLNYTTQEYNEAACISHLKIASQFGDAESTFALAKIFKENKYYLPYDNPKKKTNHDIAITYAGIAEMQGRKGSAYELAQEYEKDSATAETTKNVENCYKVGIKCGDGRAQGALFMMATRAVEQNIKNATTDFLK